MDQVGTDTSLVLTIKLIKDFSPAVTLLPVLPPYVGNRNALRIISNYGNFQGWSLQQNEVEIIHQVRLVINIICITLCPNSLRH